MDLTKITSLNELKVLAYDEVVKLESAQRNLQLLNARMREVEQLPPDENGV